MGVEPEPVASRPPTGGPRPITEIAAAERKWRVLLQSTSDTVTLVDAHCNICQTTGELTDVLGYPPTWWAGRSGFDLIHPDDLPRAAGVFAEVESCRRTFPNHYIKVNAFDSSHGWETVRLSFIVNRPANEPGFALEREEGKGRNIHYRLRSYAGVKPSGERY